MLVVNAAVLKIVKTVNGKLTFWIQKFIKKKKMEYLFILYAASTMTLQGVSLELCCTEISSYFLEITFLLQNQ